MVANPGSAMTETKARQMRQTGEPQVRDTAKRHVSRDTGKQVREWNRLQRANGTCFVTEARLQILSNAGSQQEEEEGTRHESERVKQRMGASKEKAQRERRRDLKRGGRSEGGGERWGEIEKGKGV